MEIEDRLAERNELGRPAKAVMAEPMVPALVALCSLAKDNHQVAPTGWDMWTQS